MDLELNFIRGGRELEPFLSEVVAHPGMDTKLLMRSLKKMLRGRRSRLQQKYIRLKVLQLIAGSLVPVHL